MAATLDNYNNNDNDDNPTTTSKMSKSKSWKCDTYDAVWDLSVGKYMYYSAAKSLN